MLYTVTAKGKKEIIKCEIVANLNRKENRKLTKAVEGKKQSGKLLRFNEVSLIKDDAIKNAVTDTLKKIIKEPADIENIKKEFGEDQYSQFEDAVMNDFFDLDIPMPSVFFEKKIRASLSNFGIPIKKVTFNERNESGKRIRKKIEELTYGDISKITEPAKTIIENRIKEINAKSIDPSEKLPDEFYQEKIYIPVKNVRTHEKANLYPIRKGAYFRFGNTSHAIIHLDKTTGKIYVETVPFYFVINPEKYDENTRLEFFQGVGREDFKPGRLSKLEELRNGDYFILNTDAQDVTEFTQKMKTQIANGEVFQLQEKLFKVTMISATSFDIQFRKHYAAKSEDGNINIKSSERWKELSPIKVKVTPIGKIEFAN